MERHRIDIYGVDKAIIYNIYDEDDDRYPSFTSNTQQVWTWSRDGGPTSQVQNR